MARISKDELIRLQKIHKTDAKIGELFGISRQAVHQLRVKYDIDYFQHKNEDRDKKIVDMYQSGKTGTAIAKEVGLSISQVYRIIKRFSSKAA